MNLIPGRNPYAGSAARTVLGDRRRYVPSNRNGSLVAKYPSHQVDGPDRSVGGDQTEIAHSSDGTANDRCHGNRPRNRKNLV